MSTAPSDPAVSTPPGLAAGDATLDQVRREIDEEVRRLRAAGVFPPSFERQLEDCFSRVVPAGVVERETAEALRHLESVSHVDIEVPLASGIPGGTLAKRILRKLMAWYLEHLARQLNGFMAATVRAMRLLDERMSALEAQSGDVRPPALPLAGPGTGAEVAAWAALVCRRLAGVAGPVLHAECGTGELLACLVRSGLDAYGVDPRAELLDQAVLALAPAPSMDVRWAEALDHLRGVEDASLGGLVLSGCVDRLLVGEQRELAGLAAAKLRPAGVVVLVGTTPGAWLGRRMGLDQGAGLVEADLSPGRPLHPGTWAGLVEADLSPGRPLHPGTWAWLLGAVGLSGVEVLLGLPRAVSGEPPGVPGAGVPGEPPGVPGAGGAGAPPGTDAVLARLAAMVSGPASFAVVATRAEVGAPLR